MIVHDAGDRWLIFRQRDHARHSAVLLAHLLDRWLPDHAWRHHLLVASAAHDDGWCQWEDTPCVQPNGLPQNFTEISHEDAFGNWERGIFRALRRYGAAPARLIARHAELLYCEHHPELAGDLKDIGQALEGRLPGGVAPILEQAAQALHATDRFSLVGMNTWKHAHSVLMAPDQSRADFEVACAGEGVVTISPWPFVTPSIPRTAVPCVAIPKGEEKFSLEILRTPREHLSSMEIEYREA